MPRPRFQHVLAGEDQRLAGDQPLELGEGDDRAGEGDGADRGAEAHFHQAADLDGAVRADDAIGRGGIKGGGGDADGGEADQAVEGRDQLRQGRHMDAPRQHGADGTTDRDADDDEPIGLHMRRRQRRADGDHHAGDAEAVAALRRFGELRPRRAHDETDRGDEVERAERVSSTGRLPTSSS